MIISKPKQTLPSSGEAVSDKSTPARPLPIVTFAMAFTIAFLLVVGVVIIADMNTIASAQLELSFSFLIRAIGGFVTTFAALVLLVLASKGVSGNRLLIMVVPFFAGLQLMQAHWATAIALAAVSIAAAVTGTIASVIIRRDAKSREMQNERESQLEITNDSDPQNK